MRETFIFLQMYINLELQTKHAVITYANTVDGILKDPNLFGKKVGNDNWGH